MKFYINADKTESLLFKMGLKVPLNEEADRTLLPIG